MNILVMGGTRFFGKRLVRRLLSAGDRVTLLTRGRQTDDFGTSVQRIIGNREDANVLRTAAQHGPFDVIFDQLCYTPQSAQLSADILRKATNHYVMTSTAYVYSGGVDLREDALDISTISTTPLEAPDYAEGKRRAEAVILAQFPATCVRFPIVIGADDYTGRFAFHLERLVAQRPVYLPQPGSRMNYIGASEAADFLFWLRTRSAIGPVNAASPEDRTPERILQEAAALLNVKPVLSSEASDVSPYQLSCDYVMNVSKAAYLGAPLKPWDAWFPKEVMAWAETRTARL